MTIYAISTEGDEVCIHFGRATQFTFITIDDKTKKLIEKRVLTNPGHLIGKIPKFINDQGANYVISGGMGNMAVQFFQQYGIEVLLGVTGKINDVIKKILDGTLEIGESLCSPGSAQGIGVEKIHDDADYRHHNQ